MLERWTAVALICATPVIGVPAVENMGICRMQIQADVAERFRQEVTGIEFTWVTGKGGQGNDKKSSALAYTDGCPGYHVYDVFATFYVCEVQARFGESPNHVRYRVSAAGC